MAVSPPKTGTLPHQMATSQTATLPHCQPLFPGSVYWPRRRHHRVKWRLRGSGGQRQRMRHREWRGLGLLQVGLGQDGDGQRQISLARVGGGRLVGTAGRSLPSGLIEDR